MVVRNTMTKQNTSRDSARVEWRQANRFSLNPARLFVGWFLLMCLCVCVSVLVCVVPFQAVMLRNGSFECHSTWTQRRRRQRNPAKRNEVSSICTRLCVRADPLSRALSGWLLRISWATFRRTSVRGQHVEVDATQLLRSILLTQHPPPCCCLWRCLLKTQGGTGEHIAHCMGRRQDDERLSVSLSLSHANQDEQKHFFHFVPRSRSWTSYARTLALSQHLTNARARNERNWVAIMVVFLERNCNDARDSAYRDCAVLS